MTTPTWQTQEWEEKRAVFVEGKECEWCGSKERLTVDHLTYLNDDGSSMTTEQYMDFPKLHAEGKIILLCVRCAYARKKGMILCQKCKENYHKPKYPSCFKCANADNPDMITCKICEKNIHDKKYDMCTPCFKKERAKNRRKASKSRRR